MLKFMKKESKDESAIHDKDQGGSSPIKEEIRQKLSIANLFRKVKKMVKDDEEEEPILPMKDSEQLLGEIQLKLQSIESQDVKLEQKHKKNKIMWKKAIFSAIENFKDYKLDSVDDFK